MDETDNIYFATQFWSNDGSVEENTDGYQKLTQHSSNGRISFGNLENFISELAKVGVGKG